MNLKKQNPHDSIPTTGAENQSPKKAYTPPRLAILNAEQVTAKLTEALLGNASAKHLLEAISQLEKSAASEERPTVFVELKLAVPGKWRAAELRLAAGTLNIAHLPVVRKYLDVSEDFMRDAVTVS